MQILQKTHGTEKTQIRREILSPVRWSRQIMQEKVTGMVLSGTPVGEYDKRLVLLTKERGKISAFARGARRPKSALMAASEPFTFGEFSVYRGRDSYSISSVEVINYFSEIREELEDIYMGMYFCEVADYFTRENLDCRDVLKLLYQSLRALKVPSLNRKLVRAIYEFKMIALNGEAPRLFACAECAGRENLFYFHIPSASVFCESCHKNEGHDSRGAVRIMGTTTYVLQRILATQVETLYTFTVRENVLEELEKVVTQYFSSRVSKEFSSSTFLAQIDDFLIR